MAFTHFLLVCLLASGVMTEADPKSDPAADPLPDPVADPVADPEADPAADPGYHAPCYDKTQYVNAYKTEAYPVR